MGSQGVGNDLGTEHACTKEIFTDLYVCVCMYIYTYIYIYFFFFCFHISTWFSGTRLAEARRCTIILILIIFKLKRILTYDLCLSRKTVTFME